MRDKDKSSTCCPQYGVEMPGNTDCFTREICAAWLKLRRYHCRISTKRERLHRLAEPKFRRTVYVAKCPCRFKKPIELVYWDRRKQTRTEQLAFPQVRKLLLFKDEKRNTLEEFRLEIINRLVRYSLLSLYSRLANVQPPEKKVPIHKWDKKEWAIHMKYIKKLAKHKTPPELPKAPVTSRPLSALKRYKKLAIPKHREELEKQEWALTPEMKFYKPSDRILQMAKPITRDEDALYQKLPIQIPPEALTYKATARIKELATPHERRAGESDLKENPFGIAPNALKAKASARIQEMAEPKEFENIHIRETPFAISPAALKAKASPRICELAKPKGS